jgi:serine/threonine-protein kinase
MSQPPDEDEDQIFSGKVLGEDGALRPASGAPVLNEVTEPAHPPRAPGTSLLDDPAYEPTVISTPPRVRDVADRPPPVELAEMRPPPDVSDYVQPRREKALRFASPDIHWGRWVRRGLVIGVLLIGAWVLVTGKLPVWKGFSFDLLRTGDKDKKEAVAEKRVGTPAPTLLVLSEPSGATVLVGGTEVGVTPWAGDNVWPSKEPLRVEVRKAGFKPWVGLTMGGQQATLEATLKKH